MTVCPGCRTPLETPSEKALGCCLRCVGASSEERAELAQYDAEHGHRRV